MIALRYFCGFFLQIFPYAFFCMFPFRDRFRGSRKRAVFIALSIFALMVIPFCTVAQLNVGGAYKETIWNIIFYIALLLFGVMYCLVVRAKIPEKLFIFFVVMSYGFFVTSSVTFLFRSFKFESDDFMYPPVALALTLGINLVLAKPFLLLMERIRVMIEIDLETRIWGILCSLPALFMLIASIAQFLTTIDIDRNVIVHMLFVLFAIFAFIVYGVFFGVMGYICRKKEEERVSECMLEGYRKQAENNEYILEAHHEIRHHMNALSAYLKERDYMGAEEYIHKFADDAGQLPFVTYTANTLVNSILSEFSEKAKRCKVKVDYSIIIGSQLNMEDIDLCRMLNNILENAVEGCKKVSGERRFIRLNLHSKEIFLFVKCENGCDEGSLRVANGKYRSTKRDISKHGYGLKIMGEIAEKYNGILSVQVHNGLFSVTTTLCLDEKNEE